LKTLGRELAAIRQQWALSGEPSGAICEIHNVPLVPGFRGEICEPCMREKIEQENRQISNQARISNIRNRTVNVLRERSILSDVSIKNATLGNYRKELPQQIENYDLACDFGKRISEGEQISLYLVGYPGSGKSHLAMGILDGFNRISEKRLQEAVDKELPLDDAGRSCVFLNFEEMLRKIRDSWKNTESKLTEDYFVDLCTRVDLLVIDDLGSEVGVITDKSFAPDYVHRLLYAIGTGRQNKSTIYTTNLNTAQRETMYDEKTISRIERNYEEIRFTDIPDQRRKADRW
jgi:DNA replication protein DnaC